MFGCGGRFDVCILRGAGKLLTIISSDGLFGLNIYVGILNFKHKIFLNVILKLQPKTLSRHVGYDM